MASLLQTSTIISETKNYPLRNLNDLYEVSVKQMKPFLINPLTKPSVHTKGDKFSQGNVAKLVSLLRMSSGTIS